MKVFVDTETCGLYGMPVLIQYAFDDGPITLYSPWKEPIHKTLRLIEKFCECEFIGFNLTFDWFHLTKLYTTFSLFPDHDAIPEHYIDEMAEFEDLARFHQQCVKPYKALDLMLYSRKGPYQSLMARDDIRVRRVPTILADKLRDELERRVEIEGIYFARRKDKSAPRWKLADCKTVDGRYDPNFKDVYLAFQPSGALKVIAQHVGIATKPKLFNEVMVDDAFKPKEYGYAPFAYAVGRPGEWNDAWPQFIKYHIDHWAYHAQAREYAYDDIVYTRGLYNHFGQPDTDDDDSVLACMVAAVRWKGMSIKTESMKAMKLAAKKRYEGTPMSPALVKSYLHEVMSLPEIEKAGNSTDKKTLESISKFTAEDGSESEAARRAKLITSARTAKKEEEIYDKLLRAGRFHASFVVIGTLSGRMAGSDQLNPQGIKHTDEVRDCFPLADRGFILCGGDFDSFEVVLADAAYNDPDLRAVLTSDVKIHALLAMDLFQCTYEEVMRSKGTEFDMYTLGKQGVFAFIYGGGWGTWVRKLRLNDEEHAKQVFQRFLDRFPQLAIERQKIADQFCSIKQDIPGGPVKWNDPADYVESLFGFKRYFTLENKICRALFELAEKPPKDWTELKVKCVRRQDRGAQFVGGAVRSALYGAAFGIQSGANRAANNHRIQSSGATITKHVQRRVWDVQPAGVHEWRVIPINIHDEVLAPVHPDYVDEVKMIVESTVESFRPTVPLIAMQWDTHLESWSKGITEGKVRKLRDLQSKGHTFEEICEQSGFKSGELREKAKDILAGKTWNWITSESKPEAKSAAPE